MPTSARSRHAARQRAMTLTEILIVVAILGLLVGLIMPIASTLRSAAKSTVCLAQQRQVVQASQVYAADHRGVLPATRTVTSPQGVGQYWFVLISEALGLPANAAANGYAGTAIRGCPEFVYDPAVIARYGYGINAYLRYGDGGNDAEGVSVDKLHNRTGGTSNQDYYREFRLARIQKPATRLYLADQDGFWTGSNQGTWQSTGPDIRHRGRMSLTFVDGRSMLGTNQDYLTAQLSP